jgi:flagellar biosynthesis protein
MSPSDSKNVKTAVALKYDEFNNVAPVVIASGIGYMAEKIVEIASEHNVPVFEDSSLSTVLSQLDLGVEVPEELYKIVVDIYVYFLNYLPKEGAPF